MFRKHKWKMLGLGVVVVIVLPALLPWSKKVSLGGGYARVTKAPFVRSLFPEAYCRISYHPARGPAGSIVLWQSVFDAQVMLMPAADTNVLLC